MCNPSRAWEPHPILRLTPIISRYLPDVYFEFRFIFNSCPMRFVFAQRLRFAVSPSSSSHFFPPALPPPLVSAPKPFFFRHCFEVAGVSHLVSDVPTPWLVTPTLRPSAGHQHLIPSASPRESSFVPKRLSFFPALFWSANTRSLFSWFDSLFFPVYDDEPELYIPVRCPPLGLRF